MLLQHWVSPNYTRSNSDIITQYSMCLTVLDLPCSKHTTVKLLRLSTQTRNSHGFINDLYISYWHSKSNTHIPVKGGDSYSHSCQWIQLMVYCYSAWPMQLCLWCLFHIHNIIHWTYTLRVVRKKERSSEDSAVPFSQSPLHFTLHFVHPLAANTIKSIYTHTVDAYWLASKCGANRVSLAGIDCCHH